MVNELETAGGHYLPMVNILIGITYVLASAIVAGLTGIILELPVSGGLTLALVLTLACAQVHANAIRVRDKRLTSREIKGLRRSTKAFEGALLEQGAKMDEISNTIEARTSAQSKKIVSELQVLETLMRDFAGKITAKAKEAAPAEVAAERTARKGARAYLSALGEGDLLETIRASLEENRVDLYLQPIVSLPQRKLRFYEALSRLRAEDGAVIMPAQYMKVAAPAGLMSVVDNLLLFRCVQIVRRMVQKSRDIAIFCNISGDTLRDAEFFPQFLEYMHHNRDLAGQIVFEFSQEAVAQAGREGEANLGYLASLGFALSMDHVDTLAMDFAKLKTIGFRHIKVRASTLVGGMGTAQAVVAAEDFKGLLGRYGMNLIAERVEDEKTVVQLLDFTVDFAQGFLFGEPRAVRDEQPKPAEKTESSVIPLRRIA
ncbi:MAG TPA: EAL domain-containing protein [Rhizomicrobium sp.]